MNEKIEPKSAVIAEVGWLAPDGKYYPCDYDSPDRLSMWHMRKAREIVGWFYPDAKVEDYPDDFLTGSTQNFLVQQGWIRTDVDSLWVSQRPTEAQVDTILLLWSKPFQRFLPTEKMRLFLAWQGVSGMAKPDDDYTQFEASMPDPVLPNLELKRPKSFRS